MQTLLPRTYEVNPQPAALAELCAGLGVPPPPRALAVGKRVYHAAVLRAWTVEEGIERLARFIGDLGAWCVAARLRHDSWREMHRSVAARCAAGTGRDRLDGERLTTIFEACEVLRAWLESAHGLDLYLRECLGALVRTRDGMAGWSSARRAERWSFLRRVLRKADSPAVQAVAETSVEGRFLATAWADQTPGGHQAAGYALGKLLRRIGASGARASRGLMRPSAGGLRRNRVARRRTRRVRRARPSRAGPDCDPEPPSSAPSRMPVGGRA